jgi:hypothetical protein
MTLRLIKLHLTGHRTVHSLGLLVLAAAVLRALRPWTGTRSGIFAALLLLLSATAAATVIAVSTRNPLGELERTAAARLPLLRLLHLAPLTATACAAYQLAALTGQISGGTAVLQRNLLGLTGIGLLTAVALGAQSSWITPLGYVVICGGALDRQEFSIWTWLTLPPRTDATLTALALLTAGLTAATLRGTREP